MEVRTLTLGPNDRRRLRACLARTPGCAILESAPGFGALGQVSVYAHLPRARFTVRGGQWQLDGEWPGRRPSADRPPFAALREIVDQTRLTQAADPRVVGPFHAGWIGFVGYDCAPLLERLPRRSPRTGSLPDLQMIYYDAFAVHRTGDDHLTIVVDNRHFGGADAERADQFQALMAGAADADPGGALTREAPISDFSPIQYVEAVERVKEYLRAGDIFQANLTQRFHARRGGSLDTLIDRVGVWSPAPFSAVLRDEDFTIVSSSPERFFRVEPNGHVETCPIKGTRRRGANPVHDLLLRSDLACSPKDLAELTMIVDLQRNDLGRVCEYGSVRVASHARIESYRNVHHAVSTIVGQLAPGKDRVDALTALFPGGSITGAPKIRAMQIIDELEPCRRGVYTGAIGYFSDTGAADFNIAIRTMIADREDVHFHVGGGIVIDSDPQDEYQETLTKGQLLNAVLTGKNI